MPKFVIDGREVEFTPGETIVKAASRVGIEIPVFCYHPGLSVVAQCRMCAVEVEKMPKIQTACSTPAAEGMVVHTKSEKVKSQQKSVMEFLLINHPLDCPICDKAGECDLQDNSFKYGDGNSRYTEERRTYLDLDMGPVIKKNMNRCIHCTRCIRFGDEIAGVREMVAVQRGNNTEITTIDGRPLESDYAGNYADICPTGSLTLKDFRFRKRAWYLKKTDSVCDGCSRGCNITVHQDNNVLFRLTPRENQDVNKYWMCDEGRFGFHFVNDERRVRAPAVNVGHGLHAAEWSKAMTEVRSVLNGKKVALLAGSDLTQEELALLLDFSKKYLGDASVFHFGTPGITSVAQDADADKILRRKNKTGNLNGAEKLGIKGFESIPTGVQAVVVVTGGRATLPKVGNLPIIGVGVFPREAAESFRVVLPGTSFAEKDGTIINSQGREQKLKRAIKPVGQSKQLSEILMMWINTQQGAA